jgi:hypothetical protein
MLAKSDIRFAYPCDEQEERTIQGINFAHAKYGLLILKESEQ